MISWNSSLAESIRVRRFRWPLIVLLASIGLTALAAFEAQQAVTSQRTMAARALKEYASFAVWSYAQRLGDTLNLVEREAIGAVNHGTSMHMNPNVPPASELAHYLPWDATCMCHHSRVGPNPEAFLAIKLGVNHVDVGMTHETDGDEGSAMDHSMPMEMSMPMRSSDRISSPEEQAWLLDSLVRRIRRLGEVDHGFTLLVAKVENAPRIYAYTLMPTSWGDTMVYVARYSKASLMRLLEGVLDGNGLLPSAFTEGRRNRDVLSVRVSDRYGNVLFDSSPDRPGGFQPAITGHVELPARAGLLSVDASIRPDLAGSLLIGGLPRSRLPFLLGLLGLAAALSIVAVTQLRREGELAKLRANFVSSVSHELRTPVAQIRLYLETLQLGRASTDEQREWSLGHIDRETKRLSHLVENVLRFSTLGTTDPTQAELVDVGVEVANIAKEFSALAASRRATVVVDATATPPVSMRPDALRHIVLNLLDNAVKYGPPGQTIRVSVRPDDSRVTITVDDEGPGVAVADRERIWRPFTRGSTAASNGGSGIGLTIVRDVADAHGGSARVEANPSGGARFVVTLK